MPVRPRSRTFKQLHVCVLMCCLSACQHISQREPNVSAVGSPAPLPTVSLHETFASSSVAVSPRPPQPSTSPIPPDHADQVIINQVMAMLPTRLHSQVQWVHVHQPLKPGYSRLPNHGLVVTLGSQYVLYFDGALQPHSNVIYEPSLSSYLTVVTHGWEWYYCSPTGLPTTCARAVH